VHDAVSIGRRKEILGEAGGLEAEIQAGMKELEGMLKLLIRNFRLELFASLLKRIAASLPRPFFQSL
jgi:hypothetical protein